VSTGTDFQPLGTQLIFFLFYNMHIYYL
jgi:hypothetical protein